MSSSTYTQANVAQFVTTANQFNIITSNTSTALKFVPNHTVQRFIPMKKKVDTAKANNSHIVVMDKLGSIDCYRSIVPALYYAENNYVDPAYGHSITLYSFNIAKETKCFYILETKQRVCKKLQGKTFRACPESAIQASMARARRYLDILIDRGQGVSEFLKAAEYIRRPHMRELCDFAEIVRQFKDAEEIPSTMLVEFNADKGRYEELLRP